ncbi:hypothetical protein L3Q82_015123 [Scortum barcoo]|uniref:Uncharacterized protein n=1 Tax=Scortum barcoo TaxID=214431 RepID=A0ACB8VSX2_9TELE|nr:hypothetical protein L3Q82_015123 [Scortum barcoo]
MIDFVVVSSDLRPYVLDTRVKRGAELSTDHHLVVSWLRWQRRKLDRPGRPKRIVRVCWERLAEPSVREVFNSHLRKSFSQIPREAGDIESEWTMFSASIVDAWFEVVDARSLVPVVVAIPEPGGGHRKYRQAKQAAARTVLEAKTRVWEEFGEAMEEDYRDIVGRWKKYFEDLLNPTDLPSSEEAEAGDSEVDSSITQAEVTEVVRKLLGGKAPGVDEIRPEYLKSLDVVGLSWLTRLCNIAWRLGTVPLEWQTGVVVPLFKKGDRRVCSNYRGITLLSLPGKVYARVLERRIRPIVDPDPRIQEEQCGFRVPVVEHWTSSLYPPQVWGPGAFAKGCSVSVRPEQELGLYIAGSKSDLFPVHVGLRQGCPLSPVLFIIFMDRISRRSQGPEGVRFGNHRISSLLFADDVVLLASSSQDLQHVLERFAAECEAAGMRISTSKSEAMVLDRKRVACPLRVRWRGPASSGGVQVSRGSCSRVRERWSVRLTGGLVQRPQLCGRCTGPSWCRGEEGAESKGEALDLPVNLRSPPSPMVMNFG